MACSWSKKLDHVGFEVGSEGGRVVTFGVRACVRRRSRLVRDGGQRGRDRWREIGLRRVGSCMSTAEDLCAPTFRRAKLPHNSSVVLMYLGS